VSRFKSSPIYGQRKPVPAPALVAVPAMGTPRGSVPWSAGLRSAPQQDSVSLLHQLGLFCGFVFIFVQLSFLHEVIALTFNIKSYLPFVFGSLAAFGLVFSGGLGKLLQNKTFYWLLAFWVWMGISLPFSGWVGGSVEEASRYFKAQVLTAFILGGLVRNWSDAKKALYVIAGAGLANALVARFMREESSDRLALSGIVTIGNANDFAAQLIMILPVFVYVAMLPSALKLVRVAMVALCGYCLYLTLLTGSRGAVMAILLMCLFFVVRSKGVGQKALALVVLPMVLGGVMVLLPASIQQRLATIYSSQQTLDAAGSAASRTALLKESALTALRHPLFGVGMTQFSGAQASEAMSQGRRGMWAETHNAYTQIAAELGIPALVFLLAALVSGFRKLSRVYREAGQARCKHVERAALAVMASLVGFGGSAFFLSLGYRFYFPLLVGLTMAVTSTAGAEIQKMRFTADRRS
jgi:O-antigen ligase